MMKQKYFAVKQIYLVIVLKHNIQPMQNTMLTANESSYSQKPFQQTVQIHSDEDSMGQSCISTVGKSFSFQLNNLRRTNLINILSQKSSEQRTERQNKVIMEILKNEPFFQPISSNYKALYEISTKLQYKFFKEGSTIYRINQFTEGYFILIRGCVELTIPQKIMNNTSIVVESQNDKLLRQIQKRHSLNISSIKNLKKNKKQKEKSTFEEHSSNNYHEKSRIQIQDQSRKNNHEHTKNVSAFKLQKKNSKMSHKHVPQSKNQESNTKSQMIKSIRPDEIQQKQSLAQNQTFHQGILKNKSSGKKIPSSGQIFWSPTQFSMEENIESSCQNQSQIEKEPDETQYFLNNQNLEYMDKIVKVVEQGECFGQITVGEINRRATNANAKYDCHLIMIRKQHYELISKASLSTQMKRRYNFLINLELFKKVYRYSIETFLYYMTEETHQYKSPIFKEGQQIKYIYLIKSGEFNVSKTINPDQSRKRNTSKSHFQPHNSQFESLRRHSIKWRQGILKTVCSGEIIGDCESFLKKTFYEESCKCTSQTGSVYKIEKHIFLEKLLASENEVVAIKKYLTTKYKNKVKQMESFLQRQFKNQIISRILPASQSCDRNLRKKLQRKRLQTSVDKFPHNHKDFQDLSVGNNFFQEFNRTFCPNQSKKRLGARYLINVKEKDLPRNSPQKIRCKTAISQSNPSRFSNQIGKEHSRKTLSVDKSQIPSCIKDVVSVVNCKQRYLMARNKGGQKQVSFQFERHKLPRFIQQKYKYLVASLKANE